MTSPPADELPGSIVGAPPTEVTGQTHSRAAGTVQLAINLRNGLAHGGRISLLRASLGYRNIAFDFSLWPSTTGLTIPISAASQSATRGAACGSGCPGWVAGTCPSDRRQFPPAQPGPEERALGSYWLLPRNQEELLKALFIPICLVIGRWLAPRTPPWTWDLQNWDQSRSGFWHFVGFFLVFEFLIYQARYLLNDVHDRNIDCGKKLSKQRFPCSWVDGGKKEEFAPGLHFCRFLPAWQWPDLLSGAFSLTRIRCDLAWGVPLDRLFDCFAVRGCPG